MSQRVNATRIKSNGIYVYNMANRLFNTSAIGFRSGSIHDPVGLSGINHLVEHLVCRGSLSYSGREVDRIFNRYMGGSHGGGINVRCDRTSVLYGHDDLRHRENMWKSVDMYASMVRDHMGDAHGYGPRILTEEALKVEKAAIHNEYRLNGTDSIESHIYDLVHWHMYRLNPARQRIDCALSDLDAMSLDNVRKFIKDRYATENMFAILIGPKQSEAVSKIREYFGDMPRTEPAPLPYDYSDDFPQLQGVHSFEVVRPGIRQHHVAIAFPACKYLSGDGEALDVLSAIWEQRIERRLREENRDFNAGIYHADTYLPRTFTHGMLMTSFATIGNSEYTERAIAMIIEECERLKYDETAAFDEDCLDRRAFLIDDHEQLFLFYPGELCEAIVEATCNGDVKLGHFNSYRMRLSRVTPRKVREMARKYFTTPDRYIRLLIKPLTVSKDIIEVASPEVRSYLEAINYDPDFGSK